MHEETLDKIIKTLLSIFKDVSIRGNKTPEITVKNNTFNKKFK